MEEKEKKRETNIDNRHLQRSQFYINSFEYEWMIWKHIQNYYIYLCVVAPVQRLRNTHFYGQNMMSNKRPHIYTSATNVYQQLLTQSAYNKSMHGLRSGLYFFFQIHNIRDKNENA